MTEPIRAMRSGRELDALVDRVVFGRDTVVVPLAMAWNVAGYSSAIPDAWLVVERMRELGWCFALKDDASMDWLAEFDNLDGQVWWGRAETAPLAICRAALEALQ